MSRRSIKNTPWSTGQQSTGYWHDRRKDIDIHEVLKQEIYKQGGSDVEYRYEPGTGSIVPTPTTTTNASIPSDSPGVLSGVSSGLYGPEDVPFSFDSYARDEILSDLPRGLIGWRTEPLNNNRRLTNVVQMKIDSFYFPQIPTPTASLFDFFYFNRVYMDVTSVPTVLDAAIPITSNSVVRQGQRFHFEFEVENPGGTAIRLNPISPNFNFPRPVNIIDNFTARFMVPPMGAGHLTANQYTEINLPSDKLIVIPVPGANPPEGVRFRIVRGGTLDAISAQTGADPITLTIPQPVIVEGPAYAALPAGFTTAMHAPGGINVLHINRTNNTVSFGTVAGFLSFPPTVDQFERTLTIPKNRISIPLTFTSIRTGQNTNYLTPVQSV